MTRWERRAPDHYLVQSDTGGTVTDQLVDGNNAPVNLTGASVTYVLRLPGAVSPAINAAGTIVTPSTGIVSFTLTAPQGALTGDYLEEWQVTFSGGALQTFPQGGAHKVRIRSELQT